MLERGLSKRSSVARQVDHLQSIAGAYAPQNPVNVILYGLFGEVQMRGDFLVRESLRDQGDQLLLSARQAQFQFNS